MPEYFIDASRQTLLNRQLDKALIARALALPSHAYIAEAMTTTTNGPGGCIAMTGKVKQDCLKCTTDGGTFTFTDNGTSTTTSSCEINIETTSCFYGDISGCQVCLKWLGRGPSTPRSSSTTSRTSAMNAFIKKFPLTTIPAHRLPPRLQAIRAKLIQKKKHRASMKKRSDVKGAHDRYANKKKKTTITKPTRPGVPMPTKPIPPGKPMNK